MVGGWERQSNTSELEIDLQERAAEAKRQRDSIAALRYELGQKNLIICVGSGVTLSSTKTADGILQRLTWSGLIRHGLDYHRNHIVRNSRESPDGILNWLLGGDIFGYISRIFEMRKIQNAKALLDKKPPRVRDFLTAAGVVTRLLKRDGRFNTWLRVVFENLYGNVNHPAILESLKKLHKNGAMLTTTNYDDLIEKHCKLSPLDRTRENDLKEFIRSPRNRDGVFHPHGYWEHHETVVLDTDDYKLVKEDNVIQTILYNLLIAKTVLFVGSGGGLDDPNFGDLLNWTSKWHEEWVPSTISCLRKTWLVQWRTRS